MFWNFCVRPPYFYFSSTSDVQIHSMFEPPNLRHLYVLPCHTFVLTISPLQFYFFNNKSCLWQDLNRSVSILSTTSLWLLTNPSIIRKGRNIWQPITFRLGSEKILLLHRPNLFFSNYYGPLCPTQNQARSNPSSVLMHGC